MHSRQVQAFMIEVSRDFLIVSATSNFEATAALGNLY